MASSEDKKIGGSNDRVPKEAEALEELSLTNTNVHSGGSASRDSERQEAENGQHSHRGGKVHPDVDGTSNNLDASANTTRRRRKSEVMLDTQVQHTVRNHNTSSMINRDQIDYVKFRWALWAAFTGLGGTVSTIIQNEIVFRDGDPDGWEFVVLKILNTLGTLACVYCVLEINKLQILFDRVAKFILCNQHLDTHVSLWDAIRSTTFVLETLIILPHLPPFVTFEIATWTMTNFVLYRAETVFCIYSTLRVYLLWRIIQFLVLSPYPKRHTVSMYTTASLKSGFAVKVMFDGWYAAVSVSAFWSAFILLFGYWFRAAENTACHFESSQHPDCQLPEATWWTENGVGKAFDKSNDLYLANACWAVFGTSTALGYGNIIPVTHLGRFVAGLSALAGTVLLSLFTASLGIGLIFTQIQHTAMLLLERERCRDELLDWAGKFIVGWYKLRKNPQDKRAQRQFYLTRKKYNQIKSMAQADMGEYAVDSVKINQIEAQLNLLNLRLHQVECNPVVGLKEPNERQEGQEVRKGVSPYSAWPGRGVLKVPLKFSAIIHESTAPAPPSSSTAEGEKKPKWRTSRLGLEAQEITYGNWTAACASCAVLLSVVSNELVYQEIDPYSGWVDACKALTVVASLGTLVFLHKLYHVQGLLRCLLAHVLGRRVPSEFSLRRGGNMRFWIEALICAPVLPPRCSSEFGFVQMGNFVAYRAETIFCLFASLRLYLLVRVWKNWVLADLPRKHTVEELLNIPIKYSFAMKRAFNSNYAMRHICIMWACGVLMLSWWFRAAERTSCSLSTTTHKLCASPEGLQWELYGQQVDTSHLLHFENSAWMIWVSATTVGFTTIFPVTHVGRIVIAISTVLGMVMVALMTATLWTALNRTIVEEAALNLLKKFRVKQELIDRSVSLIQIWWRRRRKKRCSWRHRFVSLESAFERMITSKRQQRVGLESVKSTSAHLNDINHESRDLVRRMEELLARLEEIGLVPPKAPPRPAAAAAQIPVQHKPWQQAAGKGAQAAAAVVVDGGFTPVEVFCEGEEGEAGGGREGQGEGEGAAGGGAPDAAKRESGAAEGAGGRPMYTGWVGLGKGGVEGGSSEGRDEA